MLLLQQARCQRCCDGEEEVGGDERRRRGREGGWVWLEERDLSIGLCPTIRGGSSTEEQLGVTCYFQCSWLGL